MITPKQNQVIQRHIKNIPRHHKSIPISLSFVTAHWKTAEVPFAAVTLAGLATNIRFDPLSWDAANVEIVRKMRAQGNIVLAKLQNRIR